MKIIIEGAGEVGSHLAKMLRAEGSEVTVIDDNPGRLAALSAYADVETLEGNPSSLDILRRAGADKADLYIAVYPYATQEVNIVGALLAKQLGAKKVIARINDEDYFAPENKLIFKEMGIELMFYPEKSAADEIVAALQHRTSAETLDFAHGKLQISVFKLDENCPALDLKLSEFIQMVDPGDLSKFRVLAINHQDSTVIPDMGTKLQFGDSVFTVSTREGVEPLTRHFGKGSLNVGSVIIMGGSAISEMVARSLDRKGVAVKIIEKDRSRCIELTERLSDGIVIVNGDGRNSDFLYDEGIREADAFIALTGHDESNMLACVVAKKFGVPRTVAEVENIEYIKLAEEMGVDCVINKKLITAGRIFKFTLSGKARFVRYMTGTDAEVIEYTVAKDSRITRAPLKDIDFPAGAIIAGVIRGGESFIAVGDTVIEPFDRVAVFAMPQSIKEIDRLFK